jgi:RHS repeat-associated protein
MTELTDGLGNTTTWTFDALGRRTAQSARGTGSQPTLIAWAYETAGRVASRTADSVATTYTYDDNSNRLTAQTGSGPTITATYDRLNRPLSVSVSNDSSAGTTYSYSLTAPSWTDPSGSYTATLDAFDRQVELADPVNGSTHWAFSYRADGQPALVDAPNGNDTTFTYDAAGSVVNKKTAAGSTRRVEYAWTRNRAGNLLTEDYTKATDAAIPAGFAYDGVGRLAAFTRDGATTLYGWQTVPNRASTQYASDPAVTTSYNDANRPTSDSAGGTYSNDAEGRITARPSQQLEWDALGRLTAVWNATHTTRLAAYSYDALDRLLIIDRGTTDQLRFRYVGLTARVAQVVDHDASSVIRSVANNWSGERLLDWTGSGTNLRYYGTNGHHDVSWTATSTGTVDATLRFDPWGSLTSSSGSSLPDFRFQGSWLDAATSMYWVVARWYAPDIGRFVSEDSTFGDPEAPPTWHLYAYGSGQPVTRVDPNGRWWFKVPFNMTVGGIAATWYGGANTWRSLATINRKINLYFGSSSTTIVRQGTCIYIPREWVLPPNTAPLGKDNCVPPSGIVRPPITLDPYYRQVIADAQRGSRGSGVAAFNNWWAALFNFTRSDLIDLTRRLTGFRPFEPGPNDLAQHIREANDRAQEFIKSVPRPGWRPKIWYVDQGVPEILGQKAASGNYVTVGQYIFINGAAPSPARHFKAHEYVHILEWEGRGNDYLNSYLWNFTMGAGGGASNPDEAPSYLWEAWSLYLPADLQPWEIWLRPGEIRRRPHFD